MGTAEKLARIIPVEYSAVIESTPRTPIDELGEVDAGEADPQRMESRPIVGTQVRPPRLEDRTDEDPDPDDQQQP